MSKYKEILRYLYTTTLSGRSIARELSVGRDTISAVKRRAEDLGLKWEEVKNQDEYSISKLLFPESKRESIFTVPDYDVLIKELDRPGVTRKDLWEEYCQDVQAAGGIPYQYSFFCEMFQSVIVKNKASMHIGHTPAERIEVDWAGTKVPITDIETGEVYYGYMFVATLPYSQYSYAEVLPDMKLENWIQAHVNMYEFFGGVTSLLVCDNLKTGIISHPQMGDWIENESYREMADYYDTAILAAPVRTPKAKPSVEGAVGKLTSKIIVKMRNEPIHSIYEANCSVRKYLAKYNADKFQKRDGSRLEEYLTLEKENLKPLPKIPYEYGIWKYATVQLNYHISVEKMYYSVPFRFIKERVRVRVTKYTITIYLNNERICSHRRLYGRAGQYSTNYEHMPQNHKQASQWNGERFRSWARKYGESTFTVIDRLLNSYKAEQQGYNACMSILKMADKYTPERLDKTCAKALSLINTPRYKDIKLIIEHYQDDSDTVTVSRSEKHALIRGSEYYRNGGSENG